MSSEICWLKAVTVGTYLENVEYGMSWQSMDMWSGESWHFFHFVKSFYVAMVNWCVVRLTVFHMPSFISIFHELDALTLNHLWPLKALWPPQRHWHWHFKKEANTSQGPGANGGWWACQGSTALSWACNVETHTRCWGKRGNTNQKVYTTSQLIRLLYGGIV